MPFAARANFEWRLRSRALALGPRTLVMGILNVTPDSFFDGGRFLSEDAALRHALSMLDEGADILNVGGESTRPNATPVLPSEERARVLPVLQAILNARPDAILSIDTYHAETARLAVEAGAEIVNDVSGHVWDSDMSATCAALGCGNVLMHTRGRPSEWRTLPPLSGEEVLPLVLRELGARVDAAVAAGVARESVVLDPGFGFGKVLDQNYPLLARLEELRVLGFPLLAGVSRKSFLAGTLTHDLGTASNPGARGLASETWADHAIAATIAANTAAILGGAHILRVHDVRQAREAAAIADHILDASGAT